ncbi:MAG: TraC family protein [Rickettsiaceae bacterium]|nr:TraC family protein [Rickettsiaceae bacterium]
MNYPKFLNHIAKITVYKSSTERGFAPKDKLKQYVAEATCGAGSFSDFLIYDYFDDTSKLFFNNDGSCGFVLEISAIVGSNPDIEKNLYLFFNEELPSKSYLQFLIVASHNIEDKLAIWRSGRKTNSKVLQRLTSYRETFIYDRSIQFGNNDGRITRNFKIYLAFSTNANKDLQGLLRFQQKLYKKLATENLNPYICNASDLIFVVQDLLQMQLQAKSKEQYDPLNILSNQMTKPTETINITNDRIENQETEIITRLFYLSKLPKEWSLSAMINLLGSETKSIPARFAISYIVANNIADAEAMKIVSKGKRVIHAAEQWYARNDYNLKREASSWQSIISRFKNGEKFLTDTMSVLVSSPKKDFDSAEEIVKSLYNSHDWELKICKNLQLPGLIAMLPMTQASYFHILQYFKLTKIVQSAETVAKLPIHAEWYGVPMSGVLMIGRRGELFNWNPFYRVGGGGNYNLCLMAPPGSGKSFFLQELATSLLSTNVAVFILDIGGSYKNICSLVGGEMIRFDKDNEMSLSPFASLASSGAIYAKAMELLNKNYAIEKISEITGLSEDEINSLKASNNQSDHQEKEEQAIEVLKIGQYFVTKDSIIYAKTIIGAMCGINGDSYREAILEQGITMGIKTYSNKLDLTKLCQLLKTLRNQDDELIECASEIAETLYAYSENGVHGRFFKAGKEASFKEMMTVFEFEEIKEDKSLLSVVLQIILMQISMQFLCGDRSKRFVLIVDEAWMILDFAATFLERFARTVRKYGGSLITCVQDLGSFKKSSAAKAVFECSTWTAMLQQIDKGLDEFRKDESFKNSISLIEGIKKDPNNKYSEILIWSNGLKIVGRLAVDPYSMALYSTEDKDYFFLKKLENQGVSKHEAVLKLAEKYGFKNG